MILPIVGYGHPVLRKKAAEIDKKYPDLDKFIKNMWDTMYGAHGVGLAAPQVGIPIRLFVVDASPFCRDNDLILSERKALKNFKHVFINPIIVARSGVMEDFNEGCLSIPEIREDVSRKDEISIEFLDENFKPQQMELYGIASRIVQHEYDHIEGILFTDKLSALKKKLLKSKLTQIAKGKVQADYPMTFADKKILNI